VALQVASPDTHYNPKNILTLLRQIHEFDIHNYSAFRKLNLKD
jgi:hypothetical protein